MLEYQLRQPGKIRGDQLEAELQQSTGLALQVSFLPPQTVVLPAPWGEGPPDPVVHQTIRDTIAAHTPDPAYFDEEKDRAMLKTVLLSKARSAEGKTIETLTAPEFRVLVGLALLRSVGALTSDGRVKPLEEWVL